MTDRELISLANEAMANSYSPYSHFPSGAAIECDDGEVFTGCVIENAAFGHTLCAETVALSSAVAEGKRSFRRLAVISDGVNYTMPCGACRQMLAEFSPQLEILAVRGDGRYVSHTLDKLLPHPFTYRT
ncbi:MAG: cytidine deaminase [Oscillospiraceae bacterium]|jgi:cytidine deaminase|nr:cytidine deaminase [Oscillospiraceae bacterium]